MVIEVPRLKDIPTDVMPTLQDRLNVITDILSRVSKLLSEDLDKAVSAAVDQDKNCNMSVGSTYTVYTSQSVLSYSQDWHCSPGSPQDKRPILAVVPSPAVPCHPGGKEGLSACQYYNHCYSASSVSEQCHSVAASTFLLQFDVL